MVKHVTSRLPVHQVAPKLIGVFLFKEIPPNFETDKAKGSGLTKKTWQVGGVSGIVSFQNNIKSS